MKSTAAVSGHPLHPALVALPIGLMIWTLQTQERPASGGAGRQATAGR